MQNTPALFSVEQIDQLERVFQPKFDHLARITAKQFLSLESKIDRMDASFSTRLNRIENSLGLQKFEFREE